jgi:hypothetical protein
MRYMIASASVEAVKTSANKAACRLSWQPSNLHQRRHQRASVSFSERYPLSFQLQILHGKFYRCRVSMNPQQLTDLTENSTTRPSSWTPSLGKNWRRINHFHSSVKALDLQIFTFGSVPGRRSSDGKERMNEGRAQPEKRREQAHCACVATQSKDIALSVRPSADRMEHLGHTNLCMVHCAERMRSNLHSVLLG